jgi:carbamoyltransferase
MTILGISEGHNCSAAIMKDGVILASASEERFSRLKNEVGYPKQAIDFCLAQAGITGKDLDQVAFMSTEAYLGWNGVRNEASFSVLDHVREQYEFYKPLLVDKVPAEQLVETYFKSLVERKGPVKGYYDLTGVSYADLLKPEVGVRIRNQTAAKHLGIPEEKIVAVDHHACHAMFAYFTSPRRPAPDGAGRREDRTLIITLDSSGDRGINATVRIATKDGIELLQESSNFQFGRIYKYITLLLGMRPHDHEFKVMGLAPYANSKECDKSYPVFDEVLRVNGLGFDWVKRPKDLYFHFRDALEGHRFDGIAAALQKKLETLLSEWLDNALAQTKATHVVFGGGVAMNIKLSMVLNKRPGIETFHVGPSPADESNAMGACYATYEAHCRKNGQSPLTAIPPLADAYLGDLFDAKATIDLIKQKYADKYDVIENAKDEDVAKLLTEGKVVARCIGRMEFGARALGNRSIMANPSRLDSVREINRQIKHRDFWMPFACSIMEEHADRYLQNEKHLPSDYMTLGFETKPPAHTELIAAIHPEDLTARPQIVRKAQNPTYHHLLEAFHAQSGIGGILNTSLNLHGHPIVRTPEDLLFVLEGSDLQYAYVQDHLICKRNAPHQMVQGNVASA